MAKVRNPAWHRDELILALSLYMDSRDRAVSKDNADVVELSRVLNSLPIHGGEERNDDFRNPNGVYMKLQNFKRFDPGYEGKGLDRGNRLEATVWNQFANDIPELTAIANAIRDGASAVPDLAPIAQDDDEASFAEGRVLYRLHRLRERDSKQVRTLKAEAEKAGKLHCDVCLFDFFATFGELGKGFIECHHTKPIADYKPGDKTRKKDLVLVCPNCHRMLHRRQGLTIEALKRIREAN